MLDVPARARPLRRSAAEVRVHPVRPQPIAKRGPRVMDGAYYAKVLPNLDRQVWLAGLRLAGFSIKPTSRSPSAGLDIAAASGANYRRQGAPLIGLLTRSNRMARLAMGTLDVGYVAGVSLQRPVVGRLIEARTLD